MKFRNTLVVAVILFALGAYVFWVEREEAKEEQQKKRLLTLDKDAVSEITLSYPDREIRLKKDAEGQWQLTHPLESEADDTAVKNLLGAVADCEIKRVVEENPDNLARYGLENPSVTVHLKLPDGSKLPAISVGRTTPVGFSTYVKKDDEAKVLLASSSFHSGMDKKVQDLRNKAIIDFTDDEVQKVDIRAAEKEILLTKTDQEWFLEKPARYKADDVEVRGLLSSLRSLRAQEFIDDAQDLQEYGLEVPRLTVDLYVGKDGARKTVLLGGEKEDEGSKKIYVKRGEKETVYAVGEWTFKDLDKDVNALRDKTILAFDQDKVKKVTVARKDGENFALVRSSQKKWTIEGRKEGKPKEFVLGQFVRDLGQLRGFEIVEDNPQDLGHYGLDQPDVRVTAYDEKDEKLGTVLASRLPGGEEEKNYAIPEGGTTVFALRDYIFDRLNKKGDDFWEKEKQADKKDETKKTP